MSFTRLSGEERSGKGEGERGEEGMREGEEEKVEEGGNGRERKRGKRRIRE